MNRPKYCHKCGKELIYFENIFSEGTTYDIYTGEGRPYKVRYRAWGCPERPKGMLMSGHDFYRVIDPNKFEWEEEERQHD